MPTREDFVKFPRDEQEDFGAILRRFRMDPADFEASAMVEEPPPAGGPIVRTITVHRRSNGRRVRFDAGHFSHWLVDFEAAMREDRFG
jgi:hypothetical protein